jgi:PAS domain S-box-containing protein
MNAGGAGLNERVRDLDTRQICGERLRAVVNTTNDAIIALNAEGRINLFNPAAEHMFGYSAAAMAGQELQPLIPEGIRLPRRDATQADAQPASAPDGVREMHAVRRDGSAFPIEIALAAGHDGREEIVVAVIRDITERKRAEIELRKAYAEVEQLLSSISLILIGTDENDCIIRWNWAAEAAFGLESESLVGKPFVGCGPDLDWPRILAGMAQCRAEGMPVCLDDLRCVHVGGQLGFLTLTINPVWDSNRNLTRLSIVGTDITERRMLESQLAQAHKLESIGQLAAGIAHEINTPTQFVGDNTRFLQEAFRDLETLLDRYADLLAASRAACVTPDLVAKVEAAIQAAELDYLREEIPKSIQQSLEGVQRVATIVRAMKEFSHPDGEERQPTDLNKAIASTVTVARNEWKYVAEVALDLDPNLPLVPCLPGEINQVILNILVNAAHAIADVAAAAAGAKGTITISTRRDGDWAEIRIRDTGPGIPEAIRERVFDPFFTTKPVGKGTGQGLAIAHAVIRKRHGGTITFETHEGQGTTFIIRLPLTPELADQGDSGAKAACTAG